MLFVRQIREPTLVSQRCHEQVAVVVRITIENRDYPLAASNDQSLAVLGRSDRLTQETPGVARRGVPGIVFGFDAAADIVQSPGSPKSLAEFIGHGNRTS